MSKLELLIPAKDLATGKVAVNHGADALYIGAPKFGARQAAGNSLDDLQQLIRYAHLYAAKVYVTVNTVLFDDELQETQTLIRQLYNMGADALIIQDFGILKLDLPPIALHASTQCHNTTIQQLHFLERLGFRRAILAREINLSQIQAMKQCSEIELETFIHGALCVCYSGQCYMSKYLTDRSGNRGECAQVCRNRYDLTDAHGNVLASQKYLLSLKDMNRSASIAALAQAGVTSFKVEGRLKDANYVKNVTAYYRQILDNMMNDDEQYRSASSGKTTFNFIPDLSRTFNRGYTDYFLHAYRQKMASMDTPKAIGEEIGWLRQDMHHRCFYEGKATISNGDGLCFINIEGALEGFSVNGVFGNQIVPHKPLSLFKKVVLYRNVDKVFEKQLADNSAERNIAVDMFFDETDKGFILRVRDEDGCEVCVEQENAKIAANKPETAENQIRQSLSKLGNTPFVAHTIQIQAKGLFLTPAFINALKNQAVTLLIDKRIQYFKAPDCKVSYAPEQIWQTISYKKNVTNRLSETVYRDFGADDIEYGLDKTLNFNRKEVMVCKYCIRYELGICSKQEAGREIALPLFLVDNRHRYLLDFDCRQCVMKIETCNK